MKKITLFTLVTAVVLMAVQACGPSEEERRAAEQARLDSLRQVQQAKIDSMMQAREDSLAQVQAENQQPEEQEEEASGDIAFVEDGPYVVQVGAWRSQTKAQEFVDSWSDREYPSAYVVKIGDSETGDVWFRVRIGFFNSEEDAEQLGKKIAKEINTGYWVEKVK